MNDIEKQLIQLRNETDTKRTETLLQTIAENIMQKLSSMFDMNQKTYGDMTEYFAKMTNNSSTKGRMGENRLNQILNGMFPTAEVRNTSGQRASCDFILHRNLNEPIIAFENKEYSGNVPKEEVVKFIRDINQIKHHGIFLSQYSGIATKNNFQIEIHNHDCILLYIHHVEYSQEKIKVAIDIIDQMSSSMAANLYGNDDADRDRDGVHRRKIIIPEDVLNQIYREHQLFQEQKTQLLSSLADYHKLTIQRIQQMSFPSLHSFLSNFFASTSSSSSSTSVSSAAAAGAESSAKRGGTGGVAKKTTSAAAAAAAAIVYKCSKCELFETKNKKTLCQHEKQCSMFSNNS
jgi:hypothetical protein